MLPRRFGRYLLFDRIGAGGMAEIFLARSATELGATRLVVVKQILPALAGDPGFAKMLIAEAKLAARLRHGNVVQVYDLGREDERLFIAMEYVEGLDLQALLRQLSRSRTALPAEFAIFIVREVLSALSYAHRAKADDGSPLGLVHRDVSPSNVLVSFEGEVKLCDFGIARALAVTAAASDSADASGVDDDTDVDALPGVSKLAGKSAYMAPEHARGEAIDARADVFAAGILLWELCAGRRMVRGTEQEMLALARVGSAPPLPDRGLPEFALLQTVLARALAPAASERFATAAEFQRSLDEYAGKAKLVASPLRFGAFLTENFGDEVVEQRRARERGAEALELGPPVVLEELDSATGGSREAGVAEMPGDAGVHEAPAIEPASASAATLASPGATQPAAGPAPTPGSPVIWALAIAGLIAATLVAAWLAGLLG
jgi:serine/threonine-protein kinase